MFSFYSQMVSFAHSFFFSFEVLCMLGDNMTIFLLEGAAEWRRTLTSV